MIGRIQHGFSFHPSYIIYFVPLRAFNKYSQVKVPVREIITKPIHKCGLGVTDEPPGAGGRVIGKRVAVGQVHFVSVIWIDPLGYISVKFAQAVT